MCSRRYLFSTETFGKQNPYMMIWVGPINQESGSIIPQRTKTHKDGHQNALWNDRFHFRVNNIDTDYVFIQVMNEKNMSKDIIIGKSMFACNSITSSTSEDWVKIYRNGSTYAGEVFLTVCQESQAAMESTSSRFETSMTRELGSQQGS